MLVKDMTAEQRQDAARLAHGYQEQAQRARKADAQDDEGEARRYIDSASRFARDLWDRYAISVEDHRDAMRALLGGPERPIVPIHHDMVGRGEHRPYLVEPTAEIDDYNVVGVPVLPAVLRRWEEVRKDWEHVQAEMKIAWEAALQYANDHDKVQSLAAEFAYREQWQAEQADKKRREAELDETEGPREWAWVEFKHKTGKWTHEMRHRIHKNGCPSLAKVLDNSPYDGVYVVTHLGQKFVRKIEAIEHLRGKDGSRYTVVTCQRCARSLENEADMAAQAEAKAEHEAWLDEHPEADGMV